MACAPPALRALRQLQAPRLRARGVRCSAVAASADVIRRSISVNGEVAVLVTVATDLVGYVQTLHKTAPTATAALGRASLGALLLSSTKTDSAQVQLSFRGNGQLGNMTVIADAAHRVKGYVENPSCDPPLKANGKLDVSAAVGPLGVLRVLRIGAGGASYSGTTALASGEVADDIATYLSSSEQVASAIGLGVSIGRDLAVEAAGGWLVQMLPFCSDESIGILERNLAAMPSVTRMIKDGLDAEQITDRILEGLGASPGATESTPSYGPCDAAELRTKMERAAISLGRPELQRIYDEQGKLEVTCEFCRITTQLDAAAMLAAASVE